MKSVDQKQLLSGVMAVQRELDRLQAWLIEQHTEHAKEEQSLFLAKRLYAIQAVRERHLPSHLASDAAWNLLLGLYIAREEGRPIWIKDACALASVPSTTGLRLIANLERETLISRSAGPRSARTISISLTDKGLARMQRLLLDISASCSSMPV